MKGGAFSWHHPLVFFTGAVVLVLEILGTRVISPFYGATVYVWSALIAVTLASLAAGYAVGGALADRDEPGKSLCGALACAGLWLLLVPWVRGKILLVCSGLGVQGGALASAAALFGVPLVALGAVGPLCIRLRTAELSRVGREVGTLGSVSTAGSVAGALAAGFWLIPRVSVPALIHLMAAALLGAAVLCGRGRLGRSRQAALLLLAISGAAAGALGARPSAGTEGLLREESASFYGDLKVVDRPLSGRRVLYIDGVPNTVADLATLDSTSDYITSFELLPCLRPGPRRALLVGLGGGSLVRRFGRGYGVPTDVVEIDAAIEPLARKWFGFSPTGGLFLEDGRAFLSRPGPSYDFIVLDAFNGDQHPSHLFSKEAFDAMRRRLTPDGVLSINVIGCGFGPQAELRRSVSRTLGAAFPHVRGMVASRWLSGAEARSPEWRDTPVSLTFFASAAPLEFRRDPASATPALSAFAERLEDYEFDVEEPGGVLITDDRNPIEALSAPAFLAMRKRMLDDTRKISAY